MASLEGFGITAKVLSSDQTKKQRDEIYADLRMVSPSICMLYVTPELIATEYFQNVLLRLYNRSKLKLFVVDEV